MLGCFKSFLFNVAHSQLFIVRLKTEILPLCKVYETKCFKNIIAAWYHIIMYNKYVPCIYYGMTSRYVEMVDRSVDSIKYL